MISNLLKSKKKHKDDYQEEFKNALLNLQNQNAMLTLMSYMDACRTIQREHTQQYIENTRKGKLMSMEHVIA